MVDSLLWASQGLAGQAADRTDAMGRISSGILFAFFAFVVVARGESAAPYPTGTDAPDATFQPVTSWLETMPEVVSLDFAVGEDLPNLEHSPPDSPGGDSLSPPEDHANPDGSDWPALQSVSDFQSSSSGTPQAVAGEIASDRFQGAFSSQGNRFDVGIDLYSAPEFEGGLIVFGKDVAMKIGGYVKADFIYDFNPIDSTDSFVTTSIPVGAPQRTNTRFHARQTRLSFDTRWAAEERVVQIYVEGDFFSDDNTFRLRHAYGEVGRLIVGRTWTTFTDVNAAPATLDFEGSVSSVNRRQAQARWTQPILNDALTLAVAIENPEFIIEAPDGVIGEERSPAPDFVSRLRLEGDWSQFQIAGLLREGGFQPEGKSVLTPDLPGASTSPAWCCCPRASRSTPRSSSAKESGVTAACPMPLQPEPTIRSSFRCSAGWWGRRTTGPTRSARTSPMRKISSTTPHFRQPTRCIARRIWRRTCCGIRWTV